MTANKPTAPKPFQDSVFAIRRKHERVPAQDLCAIKTERSAATIACKVHNISKGGALIEVSTSHVPKRFLLINYTRSTKVICSTVWRSDHLIGIEFQSKTSQLTLK